MRSCKFLWQIFHLKIWLKLFPRYLSTEYNTINSPSWKELLQLYFPSKRTTLKSNYREKTAWVGGTIGIIGNNSKVMNTIASVLGLPQRLRCTLEWTDHFSASLSHLTSPTLMPSFDVQHLTDFDKMRYYCANMQTFAPHYTTRGNWPKLFTALIRVIFQFNIHFTHLLGKRC